MTISSMDDEIRSGNGYVNYRERNFSSSESVSIKALSPIQAFYQNKAIFVTGGTGFLGKVLLSKLLRSTNFRVIYLLVRSKKGKNVEQRLEELFNDPVFDPMKKEIPNYKEKIRTIGGDCSLSNLGINQDDYEMLIENVHVVFHCAATVRFDEKLPLAVGINVRGTKDLLEMAHKMRKLEVFLHVSTAYSNSNLLKIEEVFYKPGMTAENLIKLTEAAGDKLSEDISSKVIGTWPNTYAFTKAVAEDLIRRHGTTLPMVVFRPAIVIGTNKEPVAGWIDNLYGPTGIVMGVGAGVLRVMYADKDIVSDLVPVDLVVNAMLACSWHRAQMSETKDVAIYNYVSSHRNPITYERFFELNMKYGKQVPSMKSIWCYTLTMTKYRFLYDLYAFFLHIIPAFIIDTGLFIMRKKTKALKVYKTIHKFTDVLGYFSTKQWQFHDDNIVTLWNKISQQDKELFPFDITQIDWDQFFKNSIDGLRLFMFKDDPSTLPEAKKRMKRIEMAHLFIKYTVLGLLLYILYKIVVWLL